MVGRFFFFFCVYSDNYEITMHVPFGRQKINGKTSLQVSIYRLEKGNCPITNLLKWLWSYGACPREKSQECHNRLD